MKKTFVLDTNILMNYPEAVTRFEDNAVVIPGTVLEELDGCKLRAGESGMQARRAVVALDAIRKKAVKSHGDICTGIRINQAGGTLRIELDCLDQGILPQGWSLEKGDNRILCVAKKLGAILVSEDGLMLFKAYTMGIPAQRYKNAQVYVEDGYTGRGEIVLPEEVLNEVMRNGEARADMRTAGRCIENEYLIAKSRENPNHQILCRFSQKAYHRLLSLPEKCRVRPKNVGQQFAVDALLSDIPCVCLEGGAGTAKTFLSTVCAMQGLVLGKWEQFIATRNNVEMDRDIGALPGDEMEKVGPLMRGLMDNLRTYLKIQGTAPSDINETLEDYLDTRMISVEALSYMRGRSLSDVICLLDEAQNATAGQCMAVITRAGEHSKIVLTGDPDQIDDLHLTKATSGINVTKAAMLGSPSFAYLRFDSEKECTRSPLARDAAARFA
ncbi:MAG: PhoH family protein, partial [Lachnospiraceae bacterium]